jgi:hypothetical protein
MTTMKIKSVCWALALLTALVAGAQARAQDDDWREPKAGTEHGDRLMLNRLIRQVKRIDRETDELMDQAIAEARNNDGKADRETKARLLSLRDERDRLFSRMLILSMRHGWEIPALDEPTVSPPARQETEDSIFGAIDVLVQRRFAEDAQRLVLTLTLPVVSLESMQE